ncbi:fimbrial protein [Vibrio breoganii]|uniref:hypothetical protein n=1 Tax=Vibrio breoganii TaxID=553239 RepID=UPI000C82D9A9|nr:hypothetical protein [Vibrio breoganii]PMG82815.1 fimbrial protein [Vibrio breoganii]
MDVKNKLISFFKDEEGLTVVEYVLGAALLVVALVAVFSSLQTGLTSSLSQTMSYIGENSPK